MRGGVVLSSGRQRAVALQGGLALRSYESHKRYRVHADRPGFLFFDRQHRADAVRYWNGNQPLESGNVHCVPRRFLCQRDGYRDLPAMRLVRLEHVGSCPVQPCARRRLPAVQQR